MNTLNQRLTSSFMAGLLLAALIPSCAFAQNRNPQPPGISHQAPALKPRPDLVKPIKRQPRPFTPFEMRNPKTKEPIAPNSEVTLPNGKKMTAQKYFDQLNQVEKKLNETGYSLRDPQDKTKIQETNINRAALQQKVQSVSAARSRMSIGIAAPVAMQEFQKNLADAKLAPQQMLTVQGALEHFGKTRPATVRTEKAWNYNVGDPKEETDTNEAQSCHYEQKQEYPPSA